MQLHHYLFWLTPTSGAWLTDVEGSRRWAGPGQQYIHYYSNRIQKFMSQLCGWKWPRKNHGKTRLALNTTRSHTSFPHSNALLVCHAWINLIQIILNYMEKHDFMMVICTIFPLSSIALTNDEYRCVWWLTPRARLNAYLFHHRKHSVKLLLFVYFFFHCVNQSIILAWLSSLFFESLKC